MKAAAFGPPFTTGDYSVTIELPPAGNYIVVEGDDFTIINRLSEQKIENVMSRANLPKGKDAK